MGAVKFSIILTVHDKENLVGKVVRSIIDNTTSPFEFVVVLDGCKDKSEGAIMGELAKGRGEMTEFVKIYQPDVFQTKANNAGMKAAHGEYFILIDDDIIIDEKGWERRIIHPFEKFEDVFAVSGRGAHNCKILEPHRIKHLAIIQMRKLLGMEPANYVGVPGLRFTELWDVQTNPNLPRGIFAVRNSCIRAPIAYRADRMKQMGYFDEEYAPYTWDDHDICYSAYEKFGWVSGAYVIKYTSKLEWGTIRNKNQSLYGRMYRRNIEIFFNRHKALICGKTHDENRQVGE